LLVGDIVEAGAGVLFCDGKPRSSTVVPPAVGKADDATHHLFAQLQSRCDPPRPGDDDHPLRAFQTEIGSVSRMHQKGATIFSAHQTSVVVHPGVVATDLTSANQHQRGVRRVLVALLPQTEHVVHKHLGRKFDSALAGPQMFGQTGFERAEIETVRVLLEPLQGQA